MNTDARSERILRPVRSFVLREGRLTAGQERAFRDLWPVYGVEWTGGAPLDLDQLFGNERPNVRPVVLEIGFGNGESLAAMAEADRAHNWLGIEVHRPGVGHLLLEIERRGLTHVRIIRHDAVEVLACGIPPGSLARVQIFFPDPWPKRRHHKRRLVTPELLQLLARALRGGGIVHLATDWEPYAGQMLETFGSATATFENVAGPGRFAPRPTARPLTRFEARGERLGHPVRDLLFRRR
jgi:tRNA (guanine-N7-)-methyltransferase